MTTIIQTDSVIYNGGTSADLQAAINTAIAQGKPLQLVPGFTAPSTVNNVFTADNLVISNILTGNVNRPFRMFAAPGSVTLKMSITNSFILKIQGSNNVEISGINFDGSYVSGIASPISANPALIYVAQSSRVRIEKCKIFASAKAGIIYDTCGTVASVPYNPYGAAVAFDDIAGSVENCEIYSCNDAAAVSGINSPGLSVLKNVIRDCKGNGVSFSGYDYAPVANSPAVGNTQFKNYFHGGRVEDNTITDINVVSTATTGQEGNAVIVWLSNGVTIANNTIRYCKFSAVRINSCSQNVITGNNCYALGEVALYVEEPDGAYLAGKHPVATIISNNIVNQCTTGISHTNFLFNNSGTRLAAISGNVIRNIHTRTGAEAKYGGQGILSGGDASISGNIIEYAETIGIALGVNNNTRDMSAVGNVLRACRWGIGVSDNASSGPMLVANNLVHQYAAASGGVAASLLTDAVIAVNFDPGNATAPYAYVPTSNLADGQTAKPWISVNNNFRTILAAPVAPSDGAEPLPVF